jgi:hypothetical protein
LSGVFFFLATILGGSNGGSPPFKTAARLRACACPEIPNDGERCFSFPSLKHGIYARVSITGATVKGVYIIDYGYSGEDLRVYPFEGTVQGDVIDIRFSRQNPYEMNLGWELEGGEDHREARLKILDGRLVHARAFSRYRAEIKKGIESLDFMNKIPCPEVPRY